MATIGRFCSVALFVGALVPTGDAFASRIGSRATTRAPTKNTSRLHEHPWNLPTADSLERNDDDDYPPPQTNKDSSFVHDGVGQATERLGVNAGPTVWTEFARIAAQQKSIVNLGQGFPDWMPPPFAVDSLVTAALDTESHQYTRTAGHPNLVRQLAARYSKHLRRTVDPMAEVAVTVGASQALYLSLQTLLQPGDEVILFEPFFDLYVNQVKLAGGTPVYVPLTFVPYNDDTITGGEWILEPDVLKSKVTTRTKAILLNSPHNPTGKIFTRNELESVAEALELASPSCVVLSDEVYKYIVHAPPKERAPEESLFCRGHVHFAMLPGMWDRTITISSAGKTFSATGWQVGWCIGPRHLIARIHQLLPSVQFCASTVVQAALALALPRADEPYEGHDSYYDYLRVKYTRKRDLLASALTEAGFCLPDFDQTPGGGFFLLARVGPEMPKPLSSNGHRPDWALCQWMAEEKGVLCIPSSPFFSPEKVAEGASDGFIRVAFCKTDETIEAAAQVFRTMRQEVETPVERKAR